MLPPFPSAVVDAPPAHADARCSFRTGLSGIAPAGCTRDVSYGAKREASEKAVAKVVARLNRSRRGLHGEILGVLDQEQDIGQLDARQREAELVVAAHPLEPTREARAALYL